MKRTVLLLSLYVITAMHAQAEGLSNSQTEVIKTLMAKYAEQDKTEAVKAKRKPITADQFSVEAGRTIYLMTRNWEGDELPACAACHTEDPKQQGKHAASKKAIKPLAPAVNPERFTNVAKVVKNFSEHCEELYSRDCYPAEKGHFLAYMTSIR